MTQPPGTVPTIAVGEASARLEPADPDGPILVDVREPYEFQAVRANGAVPIPMSEFSERHAEIPKDRPVFVICASGSRSAAATAFLLRNGWKDVANVDGGTGAWEKAGLPVNRG
jgi:rhodanese-related sulfurtransferase